MFFLLSKLLGPLMEPVTYIVLLILVALLFYDKPWLCKMCLSAALSIMFAFGTPFLPDLLIAPLENHYTVPSSPPDVDAIIVLSGMLNLQTSSTEYLEFWEGAERILVGMQLFKKGIGDVLIISGGSGSIHNQEKKEAILLRQFAIEFGIPEEQILIEPDSRNTYENAVNTRKLMEQQGLSSSILITKAIHLPRSMGCFQHVGLDPVPYPVDFMLAPNRGYRPGDLIPSVAHLRGTSRVLHEYIGLIAYKLAGYL
jgi:uncharacterized SAM-binding protein YcdF (DUF218 family)